MAAEGGSTGGEPDAISMSNETEEHDAQQQDGDEVWRRREDVVTKELVVDGARGNEEGRNVRTAHDARRRKRRRRRSTSF